jgi:hypothetical protein
MPKAGIGAMQEAAMDGQRRALRPAPSAASAAAVPPRRAARGAALWATLGFVCGAIFWHAFDFWSYMTDVVLNPPGGDAAVARGPDAGFSGIETGSLPSIHRVDPASCTSLELDREANRTVVRPCPSDGLALRLDPGTDREDLAVLADYEAR